MKIAKKRVINDFPLIILEKVKIENIFVRMSRIGWEYDQNTPCKTRGNPPRELASGVRSRFIHFTSNMD